MNTVHAGLSIAAVVKPGSIDTVNSILKTINNNPGNNSLIPFAKSLTTLLVSSSVIPEQDDDGTKMPATLLFLVSYSGPLNVHLDELIKIGSQGLRNLFSNCVDFPSEANTSDAALKSYLKKKQKPDTFYTGMQYITHDDVGKESNLRNAIESYIDEQQAQNKFKGLGADAIKKSIQDFVNSKPEFAWTKQIWKKTFSDSWALWGGLIKTILVIFVLFPAILCCIHSFSFCPGSSGLVNGLLDFVAYIVIIALTLVLIGLVLMLIYRTTEVKKQFVAPRQPDAEVKWVLSGQTHPVMNEMTIAGPLKSGWIHTLTFNVALRVVALIRGSLSIATISTARWLTIDGGRRLVFISNFENLSESYVRDFIDSTSSATGINILFGQGNGYPPTKWMINAGCKTNPDAFLNVVHLYQHVTKLWYWPFMDLSIDNINNNRQIRLGLFSDNTDAATWLKLF